jgi:hypothetical protein
LRTEPPAQRYWLSFTSWVPSKLVIFIQICDVDEIFASPSIEIRCGIIIASTGQSRHTAAHAALTLLALVYARGAMPTRIGRGGAEQTELMMMMMMSASLGRRGASYRVGLATTRSRQHR